MGRSVSNDDKSGFQFGNGRYQIYTSSTTYTVPAGVHKIRVSAIGGGGGGATCVSSSDPLAVGGGGGGFAQSIISVTPGSTYAITVGAGGAANSNANGSAGGTTSFGSVVSSTGGAGGTKANGGTVSAAAGGVGSSGNVANFDGGTSGAILSGTARYSSTGGGAAGSMFGVGGRGGNINAVGSAKCTTGGGAIIFTGGNITSTVEYSHMYTGGGGTGGDGRHIFGHQDISTDGGIGRNGLLGERFKISSTDTYMAQTHPKSGTSVALGTSFWDSLTGGGGGAVYTNNNSTPSMYMAGNGAPGAGGGAGGAYGSNKVHAGNGGILGGGGAASDPDLSSITYGGVGGLGGGGGGAWSNANSSSRGGAGGSGFVLVEY